MNGDQLRMARALLRLGIRELAQLSGADKNSIVRCESGRKIHASTEQKLKTTLEGRGVIFIEPMKPFHQATVALKWGLTSPMLDEGEGSEDEGGEEA